MDFKVYFRHMDSSLPLYVYAEQKILDRLEKYAMGIMEAHITFAVEAGVNRASCHMYLAGGGITITVESEDTQSMYAAVDKLADRLDARLRRQKDKLRTRPRKTVTDLPFRAAAFAQVQAEDTIDAADIIKLERFRMAQAAAQ